MKYLGRWSMAVVALCVGGLVAPAGAQQPQTPTQQKTPPTQTPPTQTPPQPAPQQRNPFEDVPGTGTQPAQQKPAQTNPLESVPNAPGQPAPQLETPQPAPGAAQPAVGEVIKGIEFRGARRVPSETLKALIFTKAGDLFSEEALRRDFM